MGRIHETVATANAVARTLMLAVAMAAAGGAGWKAYDLYNKPHLQLAEKQRALHEAAAQAEQLRQELAQGAARMETLGKEKDRLETSLKLLKLRHRIARLKVIDQRPADDSNRLRTTVEFCEINEEGAPLDDAPRRFEIEGDRVYVECLVAKFDDKYVEQSDLERATAICLFQRLFGEYQQPHEGYALDQVGSSPTSYARGGRTSEFEQRIWRDFWNLAADPQRAAELGIRAAHADAPSIRVRPDGVYELELRSTGEFTLRPRTP